MSSVKTSKAFDDAGQSETRRLIVNVRKTLGVTSIGSLRETPITLFSSDVKTDDQSRARIAVELDEALKKK